MVKIKEKAEIQELKNKVQAGKALIGKESVLKALKIGEINKVFLASNCPVQIQKDIQHYAQLISVPVKILEQNNEEIGILCKKNFLVAVVGVKGE